jgi:hypothetical protein
MSHRAKEGLVSTHTAAYCSTHLLLQILRVASLGHCRVPTLRTPGFFGPSAVVSWSRARTKPLHGSDEVADMKSSTSSHAARCLTTSMSAVRATFDAGKDHPVLEAELMDYVTLSGGARLKNLS